MPCALMTTPTQNLGQVAGVAANSRHLAEALAECQGRIAFGRAAETSAFCQHAFR